MKISVLIGFSYDNYKYDIERNQLPGIVIDLYQSYIMSLQMKTEKIVIITDIISDQNTSILLNAMIEGIVEPDILTFIESIKNNNIYHKYCGKKDFIRVFTETIENSDQIFIYYTGHLIKDYILFPNNEEIILEHLDGILQSDYTINTKNKSNGDKISEDILVSNSKIDIIEFRSLIFSSVDVDAEIFLVMDCCNGSGLKLPYQLKGRKYHLIPDETKIFPTQKIICFSSTTSKEDSITSRDGSIFSRSLFRQIKERKQSIPYLLKIVGEECLSKYNQTSTIHSSRPDIKILWNWLFDDLNIYVEIDYITNTICVKKKILSKKIKKSKICVINS